ncbi:MAG: hypothetical protein QXJ02_06050 [Candidatus Bathyarchaeia archaeon]
MALIPPCLATERAAVGLGSRTIQGTSLPTDEINAQIQVITHILDLAQNTCYLGRNYATYNFHGAGTTPQNIYEAASGCGHEAAIVFHVGHGGWNYIWGQQQWYIESDNGPLVYDMEIYPHSEQKNVFFTFLWSCHQGDVIGGNHLISGRPYGMPHGWRHSYRLSNDGYVDPWGDGLFIGFEGAAPHLTQQMAGVNNAGENFVMNFYSEAFKMGYRVIEALDNATRLTFPPASGWDTFDKCIFYKGYTLPSGNTGRMVVYGFALLELYKYGVTGGGGGGIPIPD